MVELANETIKALKELHNFTHDPTPTCRSMLSCKRGLQETVSNQEIALLEMGKKLSV